MSALVVRGLKQQLGYKRRGMDAKEALSKCDVTVQSSATF
jgi:hypothetical protein